MSTEPTTATQGEKLVDRLANETRQLLDSEEEKLLTAVLLVMEQLKGRDDWGMQYVYVDSFWRSMAEHGYEKPEIPDPIDPSAVDAHRSDFQPAPPETPTESDDDAKYERAHPTWEGKGPCPECGTVTFAFIHSCRAIRRVPATPVEEDQK